ncbi:MAG: hypothetical protein IT424_13660 [Pirellulales bacterium]|nr:hypothetical protein [Pirellulales bacterium]
MDKLNIDQFRAAPFWSWNDLMEPQGCAQLVERLAEAGFGGAYAHVRLGMLIPFLGQQYLACLKASVARARELGFRLNLYDEDRWPSGWAGGAVPLADKAYRLKALLRRPAADQPPLDCEPLLRRDACQYYVWTMPLGHPKFSGTCYVDLTNYEAVRCFLRAAFVPLADALEGYFEDSIEAIFSDEPALTYLYSWPAGAIPWSNELPARLAADADEPLDEILPSLFEDGARAARHRLVYYRELVALFDRSFMQQIALWRRRRGVAWTGHFMYEHSLPLHFSWGVNCHGLYRRFDWPGVDHLGRQVGEVVTALGCRSAVHQFSKPRMMTELFGASGQHLSFADRKWIAEQQIVLGANHLVPHLCSTSLAGARKRDYPPTISPHQPWWPHNQFLEDHCARLCAIMANGAGQTDLLVIHPQETVIARSRGPVELGSQPTWETRFFCPSTDESLNELDRQWKRLCHALLDASYVFDFGDEGVMAECGAVEHRDQQPCFRVGDAAYSAVLIPPLETLRHSTVELLTSFIEHGGIVAYVGSGPSQVDGMAGDASAPLRQLLQSASVHGSDVEETVRALSAAAPPLIEAAADPSPGRLWRYTRVQDDQRSTLLVNLDRFHTRNVRVRWNGSAPTRAFAWHTHCAQLEEIPVNDCRATFCVVPGQSTLIVENSPASLPFVKVSSGEPLQCTSIALHDLPWRVERHDPNALILDHARWRTAGGPWRGPHPVLAIKDYLDRRRHEGTLELSFTTPSTAELPLGSRLQAVFESDDADATVLVNGQPADAAPADRWPLAGRGFCQFDLLASGQSESITLRFPRFRYGDLAQIDELDRRLGTPLESLVLLGDFSVLGAASKGPQGWHGQIEYHTGEPLAAWLPPQELVYLSLPWRLTMPQPLTVGNLTSQGLPFFAGRVRYESEITFDELPQHGVQLLLNRLPAAVAEVQVNDQGAGFFAWHPLSLTIKPQLRRGKNRIAVTLFHSLRNLLGPHHHPAGEPVYATPESFRPPGAAVWLERLEEGAVVDGWRSDYCFVEFGLPSAQPSGANYAYA